MNRSPEWHEERRHHIGASEVSTMLGLNPYATPWGLWMSKTGKVEPWEGNESTHWGNKLEPMLLDEAHKDLGNLVSDVVFEHDESPLRATLDGWTKDNEVVECKTAGIATRGNMQAWGDEGEVTELGQVPIQYFVQVQTQLVCSKAEVGHIYALLAGRGLCKFRILPHEDWQRTIIEKAREWWQRHIIEGETVAITDPGMLPTLNELTSIKRHDETVDLDDEVEVILNRRDFLTGQQSLYRKELIQIKRQLLLALGEADKGVTSSGREVTYTEQERKGYTVEPSTYRVLRVTGDKK